MLIRPVILSGGSGTRLWPVSRKKHPKQFARLIGKESLFTGTLRTVADRKRFAPPLIIGNAEHKFLIRDALEEVGMTDATVYLEPTGRNTAPAAFVAALIEKEGKADCLHLVLPSDHIITDKAAFFAAIDAAKPAVEKQHIVLFGIHPNRPDTGFGYIMAGQKTRWDRVAVIDQFLEKPNESRAADLIDQGALWNSGIFFYAPTTLLAEAQRLQADALALCQQALSKCVTQNYGYVLDEDAYQALPDLSFDRTIMEHTTQGCIIACAMGWSDLGTWQALWQTEPHDANNNVKLGPVVARDTSGSYVRSYGPTVAVLGLDNVMVVATKDSVLVAPLSRSQEVRDLVSDVGEQNKAIAIDHPRVSRPWGAYEGIAQGDRFQVKHITVLPGRALSLQMHHHRAEHWIVVAGTARVECNDEVKLVFPNESVYIPSGSKHRLSNPGKVELHLIEVQSGDYLGEDDIVRFEDLYGRVPSVVRKLEK